MTAMPALKLYEYPPLFDRIYEQIADAEGEITPELATELEAAHEQLGDKLQGCRDAYFSMKRTAEAVHVEIKRLTDHRNSLRRMQDWLKGYAGAALERLEVERYPLHKGVVRFQTNSQPSIRWTRSVEELPQEFTRVTVEPNIALAQQALKEKGELPEGFTVDRGRHVRLS